MPTRTLRQRDHRYRNLCPQKACIEFHHGRRTWRLTLVDISICGVCFKNDEEVPGLEVGLRLQGVSVRIGQCEILGRATICNVRALPDSTLVYGARFYPDEEADMLKLNGVLAGLDVAIAQGRAGPDTF